MQVAECPFYLLDLGRAPALRMARPMLIQSISVDGRWLESIIFFKRFFIVSLLFVSSPHHLLCFSFSDK